MSVRSWWSRVRDSLRGGDAAEREMDAEMAFHVEMATRRNLERGMAPAEARRQARLAFGSAEAIREEAREARRARVAEDIVADVRFGLRGLRRAPSFTATAVLTMALGIGASTAMFTVVDAVLLRPLPIPAPADFTYVGWVWPRGDVIPSLSAFQYEFVREHNRVFEAVATYRTQEAVLGEEPGTQPVRGLRVAGDFFGTVGLGPRLGRGFDAREMAPGGPAVVILGDATWRTRFGADASIVGREIRVDGARHTVVGVLPPEFRFPPAAEHTGFVVPMVAAADPADEGHNTEAIARVRPGTSHVAREADVEGLSRAFRSAHPSLATEQERFRLFTHAEVHAGSVRRTLWVLFGAVSLVLLMACANTATLLLVRASARQREIAVRASIGAGPLRIAQQLLTEGLLLSVAGGVLGVLLATVAVRSFLALAPTALPAGTDIGLHIRVLLFATGVSVVAGLLFGLATGGPAFRTRPHAALLGGTRGATGGSTRTRQALVFVETTLAVVLLSGATLLSASFARLVRVDPGFDTESVLAVHLGRLPDGYDAARREQLVDRLLERIRALPGVERAAAAPNLPLERGMNFPVDTPERPDLAIGAVELRFVTPDYLATLGIPLRAGRDFGTGDVAGAEPVAIVNEAFARHFWGGADATGRTIQIGHFRDRWLVPEQQTRVVGVAADIREIGLDRPARPTVLVPRAQVPERTPLLLVRGGSAGIIGPLRDAIGAEEPGLVPELERLSAVASRSVAAPRFRAALVAALAGFALLLAGVGIYGVIASVVQQRRREIGLRLALGAKRAAVALSVTRHCVVCVVAGTVAGLLVFRATRSVLGPWLYDTAPGDPRVLAATVGVLLLVATAASWIPARRAARVDPALSLREE